VLEALAASVEKLRNADVDKTTNADDADGEGQSKKGDDDVTDKSEDNQATAESQSNADEDKDEEDGKPLSDKREELTDDEIAKFFWVAKMVGADKPWIPDPNVLCFVIGTGIDTQHVDCEGVDIYRLTRSHQASSTRSITPGPPLGPPPVLEKSTYTVPKHVKGKNPSSWLAHETSVASMIVGKGCGVAQGAKIVDV
jgi:hypothetical protein